MLESEKFKVFIKWSKRVLPVLIGATGGYLYYYYIGCNNGSCPISSNPFISTAYGAFAGFLFIDWKSIFKKSSKAEKGKS